MQLKCLVILLAASAFTLMAQTDLTTPGGGEITTASYAESLSPYLGEKAFDNGGTGDTSRWLVKKATLPNAFLIYKFAGPTCITGYSIQGFASNNSGLLRDPKAWKYEGSNDGSTWTLLDTQVNQIGWTALQVRTFSFANTATFTHYKLTITENNGATDYTGCLELEYYGREDFESKPAITLKSVSQTQPDKATLVYALTVGKCADITVYWGLDPANWSNSQVVGNVDVGEYSLEIDGLDIYRRYYWAVHAANSADATWSVTNQFTTLTGSDLTQPNGAITGCPSLAAYEPKNAFDNGLTDASRWIASIANLPNVFVQYHFTEGPQLLRAYKVVGLIGQDYQKRNPRDWTFSASHDGEEWVVIDSQTGHSGWTSAQASVYAVDPMESFEYYRFNISANNGATDNVGVLELEFYGWADYVSEPQVSALPVEQVSTGVVKIRGHLDAGGSADAFIAWGDNPEHLSTTNALGRVFNGEFGLQLSGLSLLSTYYYTIFVENVAGSNEIQGPLSFVTDGERFKWVKTTTGNWSEAANWSQGQRAPGAAGDLVTVDVIRTIQLDEPSVVIGGLTLSGPYASGSVIITNSVAGAQIVFDNPAHTPFINTAAGGSAPYFLYPNLVCNTDLLISSTEGWPLTICGGISGTGKFIQQTNARVVLNPVGNVMIDSMFNAQTPTSYLSVDGTRGTVTLKGTNTVSFYGNWSDYGAALRNGATLIFDGGETTNISTSNRAGWTGPSDTGCLLTLTHGARLINTSNAAGPIWNGSTNRVVLTGSGTQWNLNNGLFLLDGSTNSISVLDGARMEKSPLLLAGRNSELLVSGTDTLWNANGTFCIGRRSDGNFAEIANGAVVTNCCLFVAGRHGYDVGGGENNRLTISGGARVYSTLNQELSDGGGVGVTGAKSVLTTNNTLLVTGRGSSLFCGNKNFNIGYMQESAATGGLNRVSVKDHGAVSGINNAYVGRTAGTTTVSSSNSLHAASDGVFSCNSILVGSATSHGNRIITAGGRITAKTITVAAGNGIGAVLGEGATVPVEATQSATFAAGTFVYPEIAGVNARSGIGGVIFTAPLITDNGLALDPNADPLRWRLIKTPTSISLRYVLPQTIFMLR